MKIYIGSRQLEDSSYKSITEVEMLKYIADDSECTSIILDGVLKKVPLSQVANVLNLAYSKLRSGGELIISDIDFDLLLFAYKKIGKLDDLNKMVESVGGFKSFVTYEYLTELLKSIPSLKLAGVDIDNIEFRLTYKRSEI